MVGWYDPRVLAHSAYQVAIANVFGRHSDTRLIEALASQPQNEFDFSAAQGDFWFDYTADIGDGWNSTFAIADAIAQPELSVEHGGAMEKTQSGQVLIFGGDDGKLVDFEPKSKHPGFAREILSLDIKRSKWSTAGVMPASQVTTPAVVWRNRIVIPSGEIRPGVRTPEAWTLRRAEP